MKTGQDQPPINLNASQLRHIYTTNRVQVSTLADGVDPHHCRQDARLLPLL